MKQVSQENASRNREFSGFLAKFIFKPKFGFFPSIQYFVHKNFNLSIKKAILLYLHLLYPCKKARFENRKIRKKIVKGV